MHWYEDNGTVVVKNITSLDLAQTLDCGQSFRWEQNEDNSFTGVAFGKAVTVSIADGDLYIKDTNGEDFEKIWKSYFDLDLDYDKIRTEISEIHPILKEASQYAPGIRILRQEPFEALCTFIISQNNNIKRIKGIVKRLCESFGDKIGEDLYAFPTAEKLASLDVKELEPLRAGFRNRYIIDGAQKVASGEVQLEKCRTLPYEDARDELMKIVGVGQKVADCTLLFGLHRVESFPLDVWMKRAMATLFPTLTPQDFGPYAGIAQQYIFHYSRMHPELFEK